MTDPQNTNPEKREKPTEIEDASTKEILLYAFGNIEGGISNQFFGVLQSLLVVAMRVNPIMLGLILGLKTLWDGITDPVMAQITDNSKSRWGRRRPFILFGGVGRIVLLVLIILFFPHIQNMSSNKVLEGDLQSENMLNEAITSNLELKKSILEAIDNKFMPNGSDGRNLSKEHQTTVNKIHDTYMLLMPELLRDLEVRKERLAFTERAFKEAQLSQDSKAIEIKKANQVYAQTIVNNAYISIHRMYKAITLNLVNSKLAQLPDDMLTGKIRGDEKLEAYKTILDPIQFPDLASTIYDSAKDLSNTSQEFKIAVALATKDVQKQKWTQQEWDSLLQLNAQSEDLKTKLEAQKNSIQSHLDTLNQRIEKLKSSISQVDTSDLEQWGNLQGQLLLATESFDKASTLLQLDQRFAANQQAFMVANKCHAGEISITEARTQIEALLNDFTSSAKMIVTPQGLFSSMIESWDLFWDPDNSETRNLLIYVLIALLLYTTFTTIQSVPYWALGIELCPSYDGRTKVVTYRSAVDKVAGLISPYVPLFCFLLYFNNALDGLYYVAIAACIVGIPSTVLMVMYTKERMAAKISKAQIEHHQGIFASLLSLCKNPHFIRITLLYNCLGVVNGMFLAVGGFLNIYWVMGSASAGAKLGAYIGTFCWVLGLLMLPVLKWGCEKLQKHVVLGWAVVLMSIGTILNFWCVQKGHPEYQFITPIFFSVGIGSYYMVIQTLFADVTDHDELVTGFRREGMFGAANALIMKSVATLTTIIPGFILVMSGFDPALEFNQTAETIMNLRLLNSFVPGSLTLLCLLLLYKYPLNKQRVQDIKEELRLRRIAQHEAES